MTTSKEWWGADVVPRIRWKIEVSRFDFTGGGIPNGYGIAWRIPSYDAYVVMPMPLNLIARALRECYFKIKYPTFGERERANRWLSLGWDEGAAQAETAIQFGDPPPRNPYRNAKGR